MLSSKTETADYLRDFEFAQPIYDLAFGLDVLRYYKGLSDGSYRSTSLWLAAYRLDGYSTSVKRMLLGQKSGVPDVLPSDRIIRYLAEIDKTSTLTELVGIRNKIGDAPFRLRKIAGMGPATIALYLKAGERKRRELRENFLPSVRYFQTDLEKVAEGSDVTIWQKAHVYPPAYRLLKRLASYLNNNLCSIKMTLPTEEFVRGKFEITLVLKDVRFTIPTIIQVARESPGFISATTIEQQIRVQHILGFSLELTLENSISENSPSTKPSLPELEYLKDPKLPKWVQSDLHMHSTWSDGVATVLRMANGCQRMGLQYAAITEHSRSRKAQNGLQAHELLRHISFTKRLNGLLDDFRLVPGIEVDILDDGRLDLPPQLLSGLGWVVGSVHSSWTSSAQENSRRLIRAIETGVLNGIGHPTSRLIGKPGVPNYLRPAPPLDWPSIFDACVKYKVALEINCFPARLDLNRELAKRALSAGCYLYIASDAHATNHLPLLSHGGAIVKGFPREQVINNFGFEDFLRFIKYRREALGQGARSSESSNSQGTLFDFEKPELQSKARVQATVANMPKCPTGPSVIGLDLTASSNKKTGVALLNRLKVETKSLATDAEIIRFIKDSKVAIVSIDSPLGLPGGGKAINKDAGIVRAAERDLSSIGIHAYPALIPSMAALTLRGIRLAKQITKEIPGTEVIESYPGAAQDLLSIPRKQQSLEELRDGLRSLGLWGTGLDSQSHDEIDAITSAIVGRLYSRGQTIPLGKKEEAFLHVPRLMRLVLKSPLIIFLSGPTSAGKSTLSLYLAAYYDAHVIRTHDIIATLLSESRTLAIRKNKKFAEYIGRSPNDIPSAVLRDFGVIIRDEHQQRPLVERLTQQMATKKQIIVVDAARTNKEIEALKRPKKASVVHWHVDASFDTRQERFLGRAKNLSERTAKEFERYHRIDASSIALSRAADLILNNNASLEQYHALTDERLFECLELDFGNNLLASADS